MTGMGWRLSVNLLRGPPRRQGRCGNRARNRGRSGFQSRCAKAPIYNKRGGEFNLFTSKHEPQPCDWTPYASTRQNEIADRSHGKWNLPLTIRNRSIAADLAACAWWRLKAGWRK